VILDLGGTAVELLADKVRKTVIPTTTTTRISPGNFAITWLKQAVVAQAYL